MSVEISRVDSRKTLKQFIKLPWKVYKNDEYWVPPLIIDMKQILNRDKNPFFQHSRAQYFLAKRNGEVVGRIAAIINENHNRFHNEQTGFFGFFESINNREVSHALLSAATDWVKQQDMERIRGPMNFSTNETCGLLIEGFDSSPALMMSYNPKYYLDLMAHSGFKKLKELYAYYFTHNIPIPERFQAMARRTLEDETIRFRTIDLKKFDQEVETVKQIYNDAWESNWGFVPMTDAEFKHLAKDLKLIIDPEMVYIAEVNGEAAGFSLSLPDFNQVLKKINGRLFPFGLFILLKNRKRITSIRVITLGVRKKFQNKRGLAPTFYYETHRRGIKHGYTFAEFSWVLEDNVLMNRALVGLGAKLYKKYAIYEKSL